MNAQTMIELVLSSENIPFSLLHRPEATGGDQVEVLFGEINTVDRLEDIPLPEQNLSPNKAQHEALVLVPHQQILERGFSAVEDGSPMIVMSIQEQERLAKAEAFRLLPNESISIADAGFDIDDEAYANIVQSVVQNEIGTGEGSNFVIKRSFIANISDYSVRSALSLFRRLLDGELGVYWTFLVHTGDKTFVGATPERHVSLSDGIAAMTPISGTYRYPSTGPVLSEIMAFLDDCKETDELYMVLDEELKMMGRICKGGGQVFGPFWREMSRLAHTEYSIQGHSDLDPRDILRETMFAPTVTGSPLENACRVIARYEPRGRGYYGGVVALIGKDARGAPTMDSAILIRTADIRPSAFKEQGHLNIGVGATLVRHSKAPSEIAETHTKAAGILKALNSDREENLQKSSKNIKSLEADDIAAINEVLKQRNLRISDFWLSDSASRTKPFPSLSGRRALIIDAEDTFISMIEHQLRAIGLDVHITHFDAPYSLDDYDLVVLGPGPGDPRDISNPKMAHMASAIEYLLFRRIPFLAVCLSHQLLSHRLGLGLIRRKVPNQGAQREIDFFGSLKRVGFYNSFVAWSRLDHFKCPGIGEVHVGRDINTGEVHSLKGSHFRSVQFHVESVFTQEGIEIFSELLTPLFATEEVLSA